MSNNNVESKTGNFRQCLPSVLLQGIAYDDHLGACTAPTTI